MKRVENAKGAIVLAQNVDSIKKKLSKPGCDKALYEFQLKVAQTALYRKLNALSA